MQLDANLLLKAGVAAFLPGMRFMLFRMQSQVEEFQNLIAQLEAGDLSALAQLLPAAARTINGKRGPGRPPKALIPTPVNANAKDDADQRNRYRAGSQGYWDSLTPEEKAAEVKRRTLKRNRTMAKNAAKQVPANRALLEVDGKLTAAGVAKKLGLAAANTAYSRFRAAGIAGTRVPHPAKPGMPVVVYTAQDIARINGVAHA
jgi:hypothetical protein